MRQHTTDTLITTALRQLDPAPQLTLTEAELHCADAALARIVATPDDESVPVRPDRPRRRRLRLLMPMGLAAAVAIPGLLLGGGDAYGSWTPTPEPLTDLAAADAATTCRAVLGVPDRGEHVAMAERRGEWTYVLLAGPGTEAICLMPNSRIGQDAAAREDFFGTYDTDRAAPPVLDSDQIDETTSMEGSTDEGWFIWSEGYVGSDITGVTVHTSSGLDIEASVAGNRFAAWWPARAQNSDQPAETWWYTIHLADGSSRRATG